MCVRLLARFVVVLFFLFLCLQRVSAAEPGDLISTSYLGTYSVGALEALNDEFYELSALGYLIQDVPDAGVRYAVDVYRVEYYTSDFNGALVIGSGLYADPVTNGLEHVVLYTHGTSVTIIFHHFEEDTEVSHASAIAAQAALDTCFGSGGATLVTYDSTVVPRLAYPGAEHLELWDDLLPAYADGTLTALTW